MARRCDLTGKGAQFGRNVSHSNRKTNRRFQPNLQKVSLFSSALRRSAALKEERERLFDFLPAE